MKAGAMTLGAVMALTACTTEPKTTATTAAPSAATTTGTPETSTTTLVVGQSTPAPVGSDAAAIGDGSDGAVRECVNALVDDPTAPGAHFVDRVRELSVGYSLVEPLAAAQDLCDEASAQLKAESAADVSAADLLADAEAINAALELAAQQIRMDAFYAGGSVPLQFIPDGATALQQSIAAFYSRASVALS